MRQIKPRTSLATIIIAVLVVCLGLPALVLADPGSAAPVRQTSTISAMAVARVVAEDARGVADAVKAAEAKVAAEAAAKAAAEAKASADAKAAAAAKAKAAGAKAVRATSSKPAATSVRSAASAPSRGSELAQAQSILASLKSQYPRYLSGVTVSIGNAQGYQAISYYTSGRIVISPTHKATLQRILSHEIWHIIDWRDNGRIDWRESVPPANAGSFR